MSKTIDQIASDCDLHGADIETLRDILEDKTVVMQEQSPTKDGFCDIIEALYRRIEKLESGEIGVTQSKTSEILLYLDDIGYGNSSLLVGDNILEALRRIKHDKATLERNLAQAGGLC